MYIYPVLINALNAHMIHINLNIIFYTHVEHLPNSFHKVLYGNTHTHTHTYTHARARAHTHIHTMTVAETGY